MPEGPSAKAISRVIRDVGGFFEENAEDVEQQITATAPLSDDGDMLVVSWDGVMVATREGPGSKAWKEAGVASVSIYRPPDLDSPEPERTDARYFARMPESGMTTLIGQIEHQVSLIEENGERREFVVLCDGKDVIWNVSVRWPLRSKRISPSGAAGAPATRYARTGSASRGAGVAACVVAAQFSGSNSATRLAGCVATRTMTSAR